MNLTTGGCRVATVERGGVESTHVRDERHHFTVSHRQYDVAGDRVRGRRERVTRFEPTPVGVFLIEHHATERSDTGRVQTVDPGEALVVARALLDADATPSIRRALLRVVDYHAERAADLNRDLLTVGTPESDRARRRRDRDRSGNRNRGGNADRSDRR